MNYELLEITQSSVEQTLHSLQQAGNRDAEGVVLWLGRRQGGLIRVVEAYVPEYESDYDYFSIPRDSMALLLRHLGVTKTFLAAQVHSHPRRAFHSKADDEWAIVRHVGALSLVVPNFASTTTTTTFIRDIAAFSLNEHNEWIEIPPPETRRIITIV